jgi:hypothetical protein
MPPLDPRARLEKRWRAETDEVAALAARTGGRLAVTAATGVELAVELECVSAFNDRGAVAVRPARHDITLLRPAATWPAEPVFAIHTGPRGIWHPNILPAAPPPAPAHSIAAAIFALGQGAICYGHAGPQMRLAQIILHLYNLLGYRHGAFATTGEHLNLDCLPWVQAQLAAGRFPLERRPLVEVEHGS